MEDGCAKKQKKKKLYMRLSTKNIIFITSGDLFISKSNAGKWDGRKILYHPSEWVPSSSTTAHINPRAKSLSTRNGTDGQMLPQACYRGDKNGYLRFSNSFFFCFLLPITDSQEGGKTKSHPPGPTHLPLCESPHSLIHPPGQFRMNTYKGKTMLNNIDKLLRYCSSPFKA